MTDSDENLLTLAKLREQIAPDGDLDGGDAIREHAGYLTDRQHMASMNFVATVLEDNDTTLGNTKLGQILRPNQKTAAANKAIQEERFGLASHLVGVTETEYDGSAISVTTELITRIENDGAPCFLLACGNPNTGKTNSVNLLVDDVAGRIYDDLMVISNVRSWHRTDVVVTSAHDLVLTLLEHRERPKAVVIDEGSTHFDARTYNYEVANQWTPLAKRLAKLGVVICGIIGHGGKDIHPEAKRLSTLSIWKDAKDEARLFESWPSDADKPTDPVFPDPVQYLEKYEGYDPDDAAPWAWNLRAGLFAEDLSWSRLHELLLESGPAEN